MSSSSLSQSPSWVISSHLASRLSPPGNGGIQQVEVLPSDPEHDFVLNLFQAHKPEGYGISKVICLYNASHQAAFEEVVKGSLDTVRPLWEVTCPCDADQPDQPPRFTAQANRAFSSPLFSLKKINSICLFWIFTQELEAEIGVHNSSHKLPRFLVQLFIDQPDPLLQTYHPTALHIAAYVGRLDIVQSWVLEHKGCLREKSSEGETLWETAIRGNQLKVLEWLDKIDPTFFTNPSNQDPSLLRFASLCHASPDICSWIFRKQHSRMKNFPDFMSFGLDHCMQEPLLTIQFSRTPFSIWEVMEESIRNICRNALPGGALGGVVGGGAGFLAEQGSIGREEHHRILTAAGIGAAIGGVVGAIRGIWVTRQMVLDCQEVKRQVHQSSDQAAKVISAFVSSQLTAIGQESLQQIICPLSLKRSWLCQ